MLCILILIKVGVEMNISVVPAPSCLTGPRYLCEIS